MKIVDKPNAPTVDSEVGENKAFQSKLMEQKVICVCKYFHILILRRIMTSMYSWLHENVIEVSRIVISDKM